MVITIVEGEVVSAVTDGVFDELTGQKLPVDTDAEEAEEIAMEWLRNAPTYSFDGVEGSMEIIDTSIAESYPVQYFVSIRFTSRHAGYGDRTGEMLAQVITEHTARVIVSSGEVQSAIIDGEWDELNQREKVSPELLPPEEALEMVVNYLQENYPEAEHLTITDDWSITDVTPENLLGSMVTEYRGDGWVITESHPVVWKPVYTFEVENLETGFKWRGSLDQSGQITEIEE
jgi:hypothetical protein